MKTIKLSHILFSLALVAALVLAALPMAPAHALSVSASTAPSLTTAQASSSSISADVRVVCRRVVVWRNGHRVYVKRVCHRGATPNS